MFFPSVKVSVRVPDEQRQMLETDRPQHEVSH